MQKSQVKRRAQQADDLATGVAFGKGLLVDGAEVGASFHFDVGEEIAVQGVEKGGVLQEGATRGDGFLVIEHAAVGEVGFDVGGAEGGCEGVDGAGVFVIDGVGDEYIADFAVERGGFADGIDAANLADAARDDFEDLVGGEAQGVIDVDDQGVAVAEEGDIFDTEARVHALGVEPRKFDHLHIDIDVKAAGDAMDAEVSFFVGAPHKVVVAGRIGLVFFLDVVEEVFDRGGDVFVDDFLMFGDQSAVFLVVNEAEEFGSVPEREAGEEVDEAVGVA